MTLPAGRAEVEVMKGFEYQFERQTVTITAGRKSSLTIQVCSRLTFPKRQARSGSAAMFTCT